MSVDERDILEKLAKSYGGIALSQAVRLAVAAEAERKLGAPLKRRAS